MLRFKSSTAVLLLAATLVSFGCSAKESTSHVSQTAAAASPASPVPTPSPKCVDYKATRAEMTAHGLNIFQQYWVLSMVALLRPQDRKYARWDEVYGHSITGASQTDLILYVKSPSFGPVLVANQGRAKGLVDSSYWFPDTHKHAIFDACQQQIIPSGPG